MNKGLIIRSLSGFYNVYSDGNIITCKARGKFRKNDLKPLVGDYCTFTYDGKNDGYIMSIEPRKNELIRPPVANIDQAFIFVSCKEPDFSTILLDRFLAMVEHIGIEPIIIVTKIDLLNRENELQDILDNYRKVGYQVLCISSKTNIGIEQLKSMFKDCVSILTGQSGVGKSSLLNALFPALTLPTGEISMVLGRGKHTTRHVELFDIYGGWIADTPGFSNLDLNMSARDLAVSYHDFKALSENCKFRGCLHKSEPACKVKEAVEKGEISQERYQHYLDFLNEIQDRKEKY